MNVYNQRVRFGFGGGLTPVVKYLLIANIVFYFIQMIVFLRTHVSLAVFLGLQPYDIIHHFKIWELGTYIFLHSEQSIFHIFFNMFVLWIFGCEVERWMGAKKFLRYYFIAGIGAGLFHIIFNWGSQIPVIGASGAIYGVLVAFAVIFPDRIVTLLLFFILPVSLKAKHLVAIFVGISLFSGIVGIFGSSDNVAHFAHLGGAFVGYLMLRSNVFFGKIIRKIRVIQQQQKTAVEQKRLQNIREKREEVDRILDRINEVGYEGITEQEKQNLKKASEFLSKEDKIW